ncbi:MAG: hypothetical protein GX569_06260 [Candidatus Riflebacteria bacterium]|nr:hypothetical protein [Candidatus Riflebacteria bacterium]
MPRVKVGNYIALLVLFVWLAADCASAANPFSERRPLDLSKSASTGSAGQARIKSGDADSRPCNLAVMADLHAKPESLPMLQKALKKVNAIKDVFGLAIVGDLCSKLGTGAEYDVLRRGLQAAEVPVFAVPGNHDILYQDNLVNGEKKRAAPAEKKRKQETFKKTLGLKSLYFAKKAGGHLLVFLPNDTLAGIPCVLPSDDAFAFLRKTLRENRDMPTAIFCHAPLAGSYGDKKTMPPLQANAQPVVKIRKILRENPQVYLWFAGHLHITPAQKYYNFAGNKVGGVNVIHVPPSQIHNSWVQVVRLSAKGATIRTLDVRTGKYLKKHTRVFRHGIKAKPGQSKDDDEDKDKDKKEDKELKKARIVVVNAHAGGNRNRTGFGDWLANQEPDLALVSESVNMRPHMRDAGRVFDAGSQTRGQQEVAVVVRDGLAVPAHDSGKISPDLGIGIAHDRWWKRVQTRVAGVRSRVYSLHLNAVIQQPTGEPRDVNRWHLTREGLEKLEKQWKQDIKDGWAVIIGGDLNWNDSRAHARQHEMSPGCIFKRLGLTCVNKELMWLAWTPQTHRSVKRQSIPPTSIPGLFEGEHPALRIELQARRQPDEPDEDKGEKDHKVTDEEAEDDESVVDTSSGLEDYEDPEDADDADATSEAEDVEEAGSADNDSENTSAVAEETANASSDGSDSDDSTAEPAQLAAVIERMIEVLSQILQGIWSGIVKILPI